MISYGNPICPVTENRATLFCFSDNCTRPAFACSPDCLYEEGHTDHKTAEWSRMEEEVRQLIELPLSKEELISLEKQEKQLKIIQEELKTFRPTTKGPSSKPNNDSNSRKMPKRSFRPSKTKRPTE
jgi:hypothetical protein